MTKLSVLDTKARGPSNTVYIRTVLALTWLLDLSLALAYVLDSFLAGLGRN